MDLVEQSFAGYSDLREGLATALPDVISINLPYDSDIPIALVCLRDCQTAIGQCLYASRQYCIQGRAHRECPEPSLMMAAWVERFYLEDTAMRLYSAAEHVALGVACLMQITESELTVIKATSLWERVRKSLRARSASGPIPDIMNSLRRSSAWKFAMAYRGRVVHNEPPRLAGLGIQYERRRRWQRAPDGSMTLQIMAHGDSPRHSTDDVRLKLLEACEAFIPVALAVMAEITSQLEEAGVVFVAPGKISVRL